MKVPQVEVPVWLFLVPLLPKASKERQLLATWKGCLHSSVQALCKDKKSTSSHRAGGPLPLPSSPVCPCTVQPARCIAHRAWVLLLSVRSSLLTTKLPHTHTNRQITMEPAEDWATPRSRETVFLWALPALKQPFPVLKLGGAGQRSLSSVKRKWGQSMELQGTRCLLSFPI